jgi:hypothetical protein
MPPHQLGDVRVALNYIWIQFFYLYSFYSFKYSPLINVITNCTIKNNLLTTECLYTACRLYARRLDALHFFLLSPSALNI